MISKTFLAILLALVSISCESAPNQTAPAKENLRVSLGTTISAHENYVNGLRFLAHDTQILSCGLDQTIKLWTADGRLIKSAKINADRLEEHWFRVIKAVNCVHQFVVSPDESAVYASVDGSVRKLSLPDLAEIRRFNCSYPNNPADIGLSHDGTRLAICDFGPDNYHIRIFDTNNGQEKAKLESDAYVSVRDFKDPHGPPRFSNDDQILFTAVPSHQSEHPSGWAVWDLKTNKLVDAVFAGPKSNPVLGAEEVAAPAQSPDGTMWLLPSNRGLRIRTLGSKPVIRKVYSAAIYVADWSPDQKWVACQGFMSTGSILRTRDWSVQATFGTRLYPSPGAVSLTQAFSKDGRLLAVGEYDGLIRIWRLSIDPF